MSYLDSLCQALTARDSVAIQQLLDHPMAKTLPASVRDEAAGLATQPANASRAPLRAFVFAHAMAQLMAASSRGASAGRDSTRDSTREPTSPVAPRHEKHVAV